MFDCFITNMELFPFAHMQQQQVVSSVKVIMGINSRLLTSQDKPLKIYLDGFRHVPAFLYTTHMIRDFGGVVSVPDEETIVLSAPDLIPVTKFPKFHLSWLTDTIGMNEIQDLGRYLMSDEDFIRASADALPKVQNAHLLYKSTKIPDSSSERVNSEEIQEKTHKKTGLRPITDKELINKQIFAWTFVFLFFLFINLY